MNKEENSLSGQDETKTGVKLEEKSPNQSYSTKRLCSINKTLTIENNYLV
ncbi:MAG: hypothetical protein ACXW4M_10615 [Anaerolineales bacterium]